MQVRELAGTATKHIVARKEYIYTISFVLLPAAGAHSFDRNSITLAVFFPATERELNYIGFTAIFEAKQLAHRWCNIFSTYVFQLSLVLAEIGPSVDPL